MKTSCTKTTCDSLDCSVSVIEELGGFKKEDWCRVNDKEYCPKCGPDKVAEKRGKPILGIPSHERTHTSNYLTKRLDRIEEKIDKIHGKINFLYPYSEWPITESPYGPEFYHKETK